MWVRATLPEDAYEKCNGRLFISITVFNEMGMPQNKIISEYTSNDDLYECCQASSTIPFVSERHGLRRFRGQLVADGSLTNDLPIFQDRKRRQLVFQLGALDYSLKHIITCSDDCIEVLVLRGALLMLQFLEGNNNTKVITWLDKNEVEFPDELLDRNAVTKVTRNDLVSGVYSSVVDNKYLFLVVCVVLRNIFGSNKYKLVPTELWMGKVAPAVFTGIKAAVVRSWETVWKVMANAYAPQK